MLNFIKHIAQLASDADGLSAHDKNVLKQAWRSKLPNKVIEQSLHIFHDLTVSRQERQKLLSIIVADTADIARHIAAKKLRDIIGPFGRRIHENHLIAQLKAVEKIADAEEQFTVLSDIYKQKLQHGIRLIPHLKKIYESKPTSPKVAYAAFVMAKGLRQGWKSTEEPLIVALAAAASCPSLREYPAFMTWLEKLFGKASTENSFFYYDDKIYHAYNLFPKYYAALTPKILAIAKKHASHDAHAFISLEPVMHRWPAEDVAEIARKLIKKNPYLVNRLMPYIGKAVNDGDVRLVAETLLKKILLMHQILESSLGEKRTQALNLFMPAAKKALEGKRLTLPLASTLRLLAKGMPPESRKEILSAHHWAAYRLGRDKQKTMKALETLFVRHKRSMLKHVIASRGLYRMRHFMRLMPHEWRANRSLQRKAFQFNHNEITWLIENDPLVPIDPKVLRQYRSLKKEAFAVGITHLKRFHTTRLLREIIRNRRNAGRHDGRPLAVAIFSAYDPSRSLEINSLARIAQHYRLLYFEVSTAEQLISSFKQATKKQRAFLLTISGHGDRAGIALAAHKTLNTYNVRSLAALAQRIIENGQIILTSCSTGRGGNAGHNMATAISKIFPHAFVYAPLANTVTDIRLDREGLPSNVRYFTGRLMPAGGLLLHQMSNTARVYRKQPPHALFPNWGWGQRDRILNQFEYIGQLKGRSYARGIQLFPEFLPRGMLLMDDMRRMAHIKSR